MKKKILSLALVGALVMGGCSDKKSSDTSDKITIFSYMGGTYEKGLIYNFNDLNNPTSFLDYETLDKTVLCAMPNCTHTVAGCLANQVGVNPVIYNGYIYWFTSDIGFDATPDGHFFYMKTVFYKASLETSEIEKVCEFTDCTVDDWNSNLVLIGDTLWFIGNDETPPPENIHDDSWKTTSETPGAHFMCSINLNTGKYTNYGKVSRDYLESSQWTSCNFALLKGVYNGKLQIEIQYGSDKLMEYDYGQDDPSEYFIHKNVEFDLETKTATTTDRYFPAIARENLYIGVDLEPNSVADLYITYNDKDFIIENTDYDFFLAGEKLFIPSDNVYYDLSDFSRHKMPQEVIDHDLLRASFYKGDYIFLNSKAQAIKLTEEDLLTLDAE